MKLSHADALDIGAILAEVGRSEIMPRFRRVREIEVRTKTSAFDVVTEADELAEQAISAALLRAFPNAVVIGEEGTARDPAALDQVGTAELAFIIDPIDGTRNFTSSLPLFGTMVAATMRGEIVLGAIHDPVSNDTAFALRGEGAWLAMPDGRRHDLKVAPAVLVKQMDAIVGVNFLPEPLRTIVAGNLSRLGGSAWLRCAAHEYRMAASGHCHLLFYNKLMPWDHAAGWLLHREAGGYSAHFDGSPYRPVNLTGGLLCAPDEASWHAAREAILMPSSTTCGSSRCGGYEPHWFSDSTVKQLVRCRPCESRDPYPAAGVGNGTRRPSIVQQSAFVVMGPCFRTSVSTRFWGATD